jgi:hypothetical protein
MKLKIALIAFGSLFLNACVSANGVVWLDENANGIREEGEPGVEGVHIEILAPGAQFSGSTDSTGAYDLQGSLPVGTSGPFDIRFDLPSGYEFTLQDQGNDDSRDSDVDSSGFAGSFQTGAAASADAGLVLEVTQSANNTETGATTAPISGYAWIDANSNGLQDDDEEPLAGAGVELYDTDGNLLAFAATDSAGLYEFVDVAFVGEDYYLLFLPAEGNAFTQMDQGDDSVDSDVDVETHQTAAFALEEALDLDAGVLAIASAGAAGGACYGPLAADFLSISIFPPSVRPPTGLAVSPIIYQLYIGDGDTRLMAGFYGEFPQPDFEGGQGEGQAAPADFQYLIGDRVWFDSNGNH